MSLLRILFFLLFDYNLCYFEWSSSYKKKITQIKKEKCGNIYVLSKNIVQLSLINQRNKLKIFVILRIRIYWTFNINLSFNEIRTFNKHQLITLNENRSQKGDVGDRWNI